MRNRRGFTLVELMIVVAIIGVLAVLAIVGVRRYIASSKTAEATNTLGAINRASIAAFERESAPPEVLIGQSGASAVHNLCKSAANTVPGGGIAAVANKKYTANPAVGQDYHVGTLDTGWVCLKFEMTQPQYYVYEYSRAATCQIDMAPTGVPGGFQWIACANGDLDGDGTPSRFATGGTIISDQAVTSTTIQESDPEE